jgi:hypothetical protein
MYLCRMPSISKYFDAASLLCEEYKKVAGTLGEDNNNDSCVSEASGQCLLGCKFRISLFDCVKRQIWLFFLMVQWHFACYLPQSGYSESQSAANVPSISANDGQVWR